VPTRRVRYSETVLIILAAWAGLAYATHVLGGGLTDVVEIYPLSRFTGPRIFWPGIPYAAGFLLVLLAAARVRPSPTRAWLLGLSLIVLGNLAQGGFRMGFLAPFRLGGGANYLAAWSAGSAESWVDWLRSFAAVQSGLFRQARTHPPFAVLLVGALRSPALIAVFLTGVTSLAIPLMARIGAALGARPREASASALLLAVLPAVNIYGAVSLDGVVLTASALFVLGLVRLLGEEKVAPSAVAMFACGILAANALTFGALLLAGVALVFAFRSRPVLHGLVLTAACGAVALVALRAAFGYNHLHTFLVATRTENPGGFQGLVEPLHYALTRLEDVGNVAIFLSVPVLAALFLRRPHRVTTVAVILLLVMFVTGAYRTGETARACLFVVPFIGLSFARLGAERLRLLTIAAAIQTIGMQVLGNYGW
jgi:hypothetical protein